MRATLPYFIPMPLSPIGTYGAVIAMNRMCGNLRAVFDIGISGPLAGLLPTLVFCLGLSCSHCQPWAGRLWRAAAGKGDLHSGPAWADLAKDIAYHPIAFAGWVGLLITSINLMPIGQLDGGHIVYGMFPKKAHCGVVAASGRGDFPFNPLLAAHVVADAGPGHDSGTRHPPTALMTMRRWAFGGTALGLATLAFLVIGFTPVPIRL